MIQKLAIATGLALGLAACQTTSDQEVATNTTAAATAPQTPVFEESATLYLSGRTEFDNDWTAILKPDGTGSYTDVDVGTTQGATWPVTYTVSGRQYLVQMPKDYAWSGVKWKGQWAFLFDGDGACIEAVFTGNRAFRQPSASTSTCRVEVR